MFPTDYFRYCSSSCTLTGALTDFSYKENVLYNNGTSKDNTIVSTNNY
jgi:hypothetical protein